MHEMKRFSIRTILIATLVIAIGLVVYKSMKGPPRPYHSMERIISGCAGDTRNGNAWEIYIPPDIDGPYRTIGDDWSGILPYQTAPGEPFKAWVELESGRRTCDLPAVANHSYLIIPLENRKSQRTMLVMTRNDR
jgi:hypothetical protein